MTGVEKVYQNKKLLALIFRSLIRVDGVKFLTEDANDLQVGIHNRQKGIKLAPHVHKFTNPSVVSTIQELLLVLNGRIRVNLYTSQGMFVLKKILKTGDSILLIRGGHGVDFLEDARVFEVKQGPFSATIHKKIYFKNSK